MRAVYLIAVLVYAECANITPQPVSPSTEKYVSTTSEEKESTANSLTNVSETTSSAATTTTTLNATTPQTTVTSTTTAKTISYFSYARSRNRPNWKEKDWSYKQTRSKTKSSKKLVKHKPKKRKSKHVRKRLLSPVPKKTKSKAKSDYIDDKEKDLNRPVKKKCLKCEKNRQKKQIEENRRESFKKQLLEKLKIDLTKPIPIPKIAPEVLRRSIIKDDPYRDNNGDIETTEVVIFGDDITHTCKKHKSTGCFKFNLRDKIPGRVTHAELMLFKLHDPNDGQQSIILSELTGTPKVRNLVRTNIVTRLDTDITQGWLTFDVGKVVRKWADEPKTNNGIAIKCKTCARKSHKHLYSRKEGYRPVLIIHIVPTSNRRSRRGIDCGWNVNHCCKHEFYISFSEIQMIRIIHPQGIMANYCTGPCNQHTDGHYNHTAFLQGVRYHSETANDTIVDAVAPCCGAVRLTSRSMMYVADDKSLRHAVVPNVAVEECGCL